MKILHVTKKYPHAMGGDATVVSHLQAQQQAAGHKVIIVTSRCDEIQKGNNIYKFGIKDTAAGLDAITPKRIVSLLALFFKMLSVLRKERPNVIHTHSVDMAFFVSLAARLYRIPIIHTFHIVTFYDNTQHLLRRKTEMWFAKKAKPHAITAPNMYDVKKLQTAGLSQTMLLPNGVDLNFWKTKTQPKYSKIFTFLTVGRLEHQKGYEYLIKAASLLVSKTTAPFRIVIVGEGSGQAALKQLVRELKLTSIVALAGRKDPQEIRELLAQANAFVLSSLFETTPITLLEAWAAKIPVITTPVGILRNATAHFNAAYVVLPKNSQALMETMHHCMTDTLLRNKIANNGHAEAQKYTWPQIAQTAEAIYKGTQ